MSKLADTVKAFGKMLLLSKPTRLPRVDGGRIIIMGNGPSLRHVIDSHSDILKRCDTMAVNFAANDDAFYEIRPKYYILMDPHFFCGRKSDPNVDSLLQRLEAVSWPMTLFVPSHSLPSGFRIEGDNLTVCRVNSVGIDGYRWLREAAYGMKRCMPRPRNVLVAAIMTAIWMGYDRIDIVGADHSWFETLAVDDDNRLVTVQPHFYKDSDSEHRRVAQVYSDVKLHQFLGSMSVVFNSYHEIASFARRVGVTITNCTPHSFIDAFDRGEL